MEIRSTYVLSIRLALMSGRNRDKCPKILKMNEAWKVFLGLGLGLHHTTLHVQKIQR